MARAADPPAHGKPVEVLTRFSLNAVPSEIRQRFEGAFGLLDRVFVRTADNPRVVLIDESVARELLGQAFSAEQVDQVIAAHSSVLTSTGLDPVPLPQLESAGIHLRPASRDDYERAGLHANSGAETMRTAFEHTYPRAANVIDMSTTDLDNLIKTKMQGWAQNPPQLSGPLFAPAITAGQFWSCMYNHLWAIIVFAVISALGAWGVAIGAIVVVGLSTTILFWLIVAAFGLAVAVITLDCLLSG
jgi:hypothetical protein